jgi:predicted nuclease of predicted toxin-antitoxin system
MNLSPQWSEFFGEHGLDAFHWADVGDPKASDREILDWARDNGCVVFSHDLDFSRLLALSGAHGPSVLQLRGEDVLPEAVGLLVLAVVHQNQEFLERGALVVVDAETARARILPLR